jgi:ankyrin repeat protein
MLLSKGADPMSRDNLGQIPLHHAVLSINLDPLLVEGVDVNVADKDGFTPLHYAADKNYIAGIERLLAHGANVNLKTNAGETPLMLALKKNNSCAELLRKAGAKE